jgi:hypothetical protein
MSLFARVLNLAARHVARVTAANLRPEGLHREYAVAR